MLFRSQIERFAGAGNFASYARCVDSRRLSNNKQKGSNNRKCGNKHLAWAFVEAAHFAARSYPECRRFYERKKANQRKYQMRLQNDALHAEIEGLENKLLELDGEVRQCIADSAAAAQTAAEQLADGTLRVTLVDGDRALEKTIRASLQVGDDGFEAAPAAVAFPPVACEGPAESRLPSGWSPSGTVGGLESPLQIGRAHV